jgi:hypothetical protein
VCFLHTVFLSHFLQVHKTGGQLNEILFEHHAAIAFEIHPILPPFS